MEVYITCSWNRRQNIFKKSIHPKLMNWFSAIKTATEILQKSTRWIIWKCKGPRRAKIMWKEQSWRTYPPWFQDWSKDRLDRQTDRDISMEQKKLQKQTYTYLAISFSTKGPCEFGGQCTIFSTNDTGKIAIHQNTNLNSYRTPYTN